MQDERKYFFASVYKLVRFSDVAVEVVDARDVAGTRVRKMDRPFASKVILAATKADLVGDEIRAREATNADNLPIVFFSARSREGYRELLDQVRLKAELSRKGKNRDALVVVFGIPNVGKSSLINVLAGRKAAKTGFKPGVTRGVQWVRIGERLLLHDTAGVVDLREKEGSLALKAAKDVEELVDPEAAALELINRFIFAGKRGLADAYRIPFFKDEHKTLEAIAKKRGLLLKAGEPNLFEAAKIIVREFQKGKFVF